MRRSSIIGLVRRLAGPSFGTWEPPEEGSLASLGRDTVGRYAANVRLSEALAAAYRFDVLHYWQPVIWSKPPPLNDYEEGILRSMDRQHPFLEGLGRAVYAAIGEEPGLAANRRFHDLSRVFGADDFVFWDWCHLSETGNRRIADEIGRDVRALLATRAEALARASEAVLPPGAGERRLGWRRFSER
jgi:hypothetical protein